MTEKRTFALLSSVKAKSVEWLWEPLIPLGMITIMEGDPGEGKSFLAMHLASVVSNGGKLPDGTLVEQRSVVYVSAEDDAAYTIRPRVDAMGGDTQKIWIQQSDLSFDDDGFEKLISQLEEDDVGLVVVDPLVAYVPSKTDMHRSNSIRPMLGRLKEIAEDYGCSIILIRHLTKMKHDKAIHQGGGSVDLIGAARSAFLIATDPQDKNRRILAHVKHNVGPRSNSWAYQLHKAEGDEIPRLKWLGQSSLTVEDLTSNQSGAEQRPRANAIDFLRNALRDGPRKASDLQAEAEEQGISPRTLARARKKLNIKSKQQRRVWYWSLSDTKP